MQKYYVRDRNYGPLTRQPQGEIVQISSDVINVRRLFSEKEEIEQNGHDAVAVGRRLRRHIKSVPREVIGHLAKYFLETPPKGLSLDKQYTRPHAWMY